MPLLSIILPTYNRADLLPRAIDSVLKQGFQNWELLIWDDGSTDQTREVAGSFTDLRIHYSHSDNKGMSAALNNAIALSQGEFIAFLDDDDEWLPEKSTHQIQCLQDHPGIDLVFGNFLNHEVATGKQGAGFSQNRPAMSCLTTEQIGQDAQLIRAGFLESLALSNYIAFDSVILRREVLEKVGAFNEELRNGQDFEYWWRFGLLGGTAAFTNRLVLNRYKYPRGLSSRSFSTHQNHFKALDTCAAHAVNSGQSHLVKLLDPSYRNAWQNRITWLGSQGETREAWTAFRNSLKYGFRPGSVRLLLQAFVQSLFAGHGPK